MRTQIVHALTRTGISLRVAERALKYPTAGLCLYEAAAILTNRAPTLTQLTSRRKWLAGAIAGAVFAHLAFDDH